ncbi:MAG TPA: hypothetical protein VJG83_00020 [archaeon]|nr:hypothetical protein [archaeon]
MNNHDILVDVIKEKELLEKISPKFFELHDLDQIMQQADNPKVLAALMYRIVAERERTNKMLESINEKYDKIMLTLKTTPETPIQNSTQNKFEVLPEPDQAILKLIEERGGCSANDIKTMMNYKGLNAACQRLNRLFKEGHLTKVQSGRKVLYLAKS